MCQVEVTRFILEFLKKYIRRYRRLSSKTTYENPYHRAHAIVILLLLFPIAYFAYSERSFGEFFSGISVGAFILGVTIVLANFLIFEPLKNWHSDREVAVGLFLAKRTIYEYTRSLELEIIKVCDYENTSFKTRREAVDLRGGIHTNKEALDTVISELECKKSFSNMATLSSQNFTGNMRIYKGLINEIKSLKNIIVMLPSILKPYNYIGEAAFNSYSFIIKSMKNSDSLALEIDNLEVMLLEDKFCDSDHKKSAEEYLVIRVKQLYAEAFSLHGHLKHLEKLESWSSEKMQDRF